MASATATQRLQREIRAFLKDPPPHVRARPNPANILEWHYLLDGPLGTPYEGGQYHGKLLFPASYPFKPPSVLMLTPNGRFQPNARICMSMSDYHPETWNPLWSVSSILSGLLSFMVRVRGWKVLDTRSLDSSLNPPPNKCEDATTAGSIQCTDQEKRRLASDSAAYNSKNPAFKKAFPELVTAKGSEDASKATGAQEKDTSSHLTRREEGGSSTDGSAEGSRQKRDAPEKLGTNFVAPNASTLIALALVAAVLAAVVSSWK